LGGSKADNCLKKWLADRAACHSSSPSTDCRVEQPG
jgi:hypothetical protein